MEEVSMPRRKTGEALLKIRCVGICGTDYHAFEGRQPYFTYPRVLGHEISAEVVESDSGSILRPGTMVSVLPYYACGNCIACRRGTPNCCMRIQVAGVHTDGGFQEYLSISESYLVVAETLSSSQLAMIEPLSISAHAVSRSGAGKGDCALIMGMGPIGLGIAAISRARGIQVIAIDLNPDRLRFAAEKLGVETTILLNDQSLGQVEELTAGEFVPFVFDATGSKAAIESGLSYLAHGGRFILVGLQKEAFAFSHPEFHKRETTLMSSRNATRKDFEEVCRLILENRIPTEAFITERVIFDKLESEFPLLLARRSELIKVLVDFA